MGILSQNGKCEMSVHATPKNNRTGGNGNACYISFETFVKLLEESREYSDYEMYAGERGWQEWMDQFEQEPELISKILGIVFRMGNSKIQDERKMIGISSRAEMSRKYRIPLRTLENWELNESNVPNYTMNLILYTFFLETLNVEESEND